MEQLNAIATLTGTLETFNRVGDKDAIKVVTEKILELVKNLKVA